MEMESNKWASFSTRNVVEKGEDEEEEEEALSLCDLPLKKEDDQSRKEATGTTKIQDDFDFCSLLKESEMCSADEVFFQGQILPLRPSVSSESCSNSQNASRCISRSTSMERSYSSGFTSGSSRSSSIRSHQSSSSSSSSGGGGSSTNTPNHKPRVRNRFHSHPTPKPPLKYSNIRNKNVGNSNQKSTMWSLFRLGLLTPPEIALQDLKLRSNNIINNKAFGSRNSSSSSGLSNGSNVKASMKKKQSIFYKNGPLFGGCKCTVNAVETVPSRVVTIRRSASVNEAYSHEEDEDKSASKGTKQKQEGKQGSTLHRTFEWLKQLSLEGQNTTVEE